MSKFHTLSVTDVTRETKDAVAVQFDIPEALQEVFGYLPGQHIVLRARINGEDIRRPYSICASAKEQAIRIAAKAIPDGRMSNFLNHELSAGMTLEVFPPSGRFHLVKSEASQKEIVAFAGGSGITPIISIVKSALEDDDTSRVTLFYGNRSPEDIIFLERIADLKDRYTDRFDCHHILEQDREVELQSGLLDESKCRELIDAFVDTPRIDAFLICGPEPMLKAVEATLSSLGVPKDKVMSERFVMEGEATRERSLSATQAESTASQIELIIDGASTTIDFQPEDPSLLDAAVTAGLDIPFACKGGVCTTCRAKVLDGSVHQSVNYGLEQEEIEAGYILTCQSIPTSPNVKLSFDD